MSEEIKDFQKASLIKDEPSQEDAFSGKGHRRTAKALAIALEDLSQVDSLIGLEGEWGSGKSTVINLVKNETGHSINDNSKLHFFCFDLWSHQPEILKLSFLEEFIAWAAMPERKLLNPEEAQKHQKCISDKIITTRIENKRQYKLSAVLFIFLFPLLPIAYTWLSPLTFSASMGEDSFVGPARWIAVIYVALIYALFLWAFVSDAKQWTRNAIKLAFSSAAKVFTKETDYDELTQHIKENSPTSERFQSFFRKVLSDVQKEGDRVILVMDNIDRLPKDLLLQFWAETRSIVSNVSHAEELKNAHITGIIPFDTKCIVEAYKEGDTAKEAEAIHSARSIIEKTFDTTVKVSPPLSTDWRSFLNTCLIKAFQHDISEKEKYRIYRLLDMHFKEKSMYPTPRAIISYINQIVMLWNQWGEEGIPMANMALYSLLKQNIEANPEILKIQAVASEDQKRVMGSSDWHKDIIALFYNVHPDNAYEIVLGQDIERDIKKKNGDAFVKLSEQVGFAEVLPEIIKKYAEQWVRNKSYDLSIVAQNLNSIDGSEDYVREGWAALCEAVPYMDDCEVEDVEHYFGLGKIIEHAPRSEALQISRKLLSWFSGNFPAEDLGDPAYEAYLWSKFFDVICLALSTFEGNLSELFQKSTKLPEGVAFAVCVCAYSSTMDGFEYKYLNRSYKISALKDAASELAGKRPELIAEIVKVKPDFLDDSIAKSAVDYIMEQLGTENLSIGVSSDLVDTLSELLCISENRDELKDLIVEHVNDGTFVHNFNTAHESSDHKTMANIIWLSCETLNGECTLDQTPLQSHPYFGNVLSQYHEYLEYIENLDESDNEIEIISDLIRKSDGFQKWWNFSAQEDSMNFMRLSFRKYVESMNFTTLPTQAIVKDYSSLKAVLGEDLSDKFLEKFGGWSTDFGKYFSGEQCLEIDLEFINAVGQAENKELRSVESLVDAYFNAFEVEDWRSFLFDGEDKQISLLISRISQGSYKPPLANFRPAMLEHIKQILSGKHTVKNSLDKWEALLDGLQKNTRDKLAKDVFIDLKDITTSASSVEHFVSVYPNFSRALPLDENPNLAIEQIITPLISADESVAEGFISTNREKVVSCLKNASENALGLVVEAIENQLSNATQEESSNWLKELASESGIFLQSEGQDLSDDPDEAD